MFAYSPILPFPPLLIFIYPHISSLDHSLIHSAESRSRGLLNAKKERRHFTYSIFYLSYRG
jgi:hypothetical protein